MCTGATDGHMFHHGGKRKSTPRSPLPVMNLHPRVIEGRGNVTDV
jgi:hypothetical protein